MHAWVKTQNVRGTVGLWMRIDRLHVKDLALDKMMDRPITGTTDWQEYSFVLDVDDEASNFSFGMLLAGEGKAWMNGIAFEVVDSEVPTTEIALKRQRPINLSILDAPNKGAGALPSKA